MNVKSYPLLFTEEQLNKIGEKASSLGMTKKEFIFQAIKEKLEK